MIYIGTHSNAPCNKPRAVHGFHSLNTIDKGVLQLLVAAGKAAGPLMLGNGEARTPGGDSGSSGQRCRRCLLDASLPVDVARQYLYSLFFYVWL